MNQHAARRRTMAGKLVDELSHKTDTAWGNITRQLQGMEPYLERADAPGEWTTRQVLCHLLFEPGWDPVAKLKTFAERDYPVIDIQPGRLHVTDERTRMTLRQFVDTLDAQRRGILSYLDGLTEADLQRRK